jgi:hypothetical protein
MAARAADRAAADQTAYLEWKLQEKAEREYHARVQHLLQVSLASASYAVMAQHQSAHVSTARYY